MNVLRLIDWLFLFSYKIYSILADIEYAIYRWERELFFFISQW